MIDIKLFQRGHINVRIYGGAIDDYDVAITDFYFEGILGCTGEVTDSNGSEYELAADLTWDDHFDIIFTVEPAEFETINGTIVSFEQLIVRCTGQVIPIDGRDVLDIKTYDVTSST